MRLQPEDNRIAQLRQLWLDVFGDEEAYVDLFFTSAFSDCLCFAKTTASEVVSALYLLDCSVCVDEMQYPGLYLYAAATAPHCRNKGNMGALIEEAKAVLDSEKYAFIALVPATDGLYDYYKKFGFRTAMYLYEGDVRVDLTDASLCSAETYAVQRSKLPNAFHWSTGNFSYALSCLQYYQTVPARTSAGMLLHDGETAAELLIPSALQTGTLLHVRTPFSLPGTEKRPFGMLYTKNAALQKALSQHEIYMNLALD